MSLQQFFGEASGPYLAVIDGRFLPMDDISVDIQQEKEPAYASNSIQSIGTVSTSQQVEIGFKTRRDPMMRNAHQVTQRMFLYSRDMKMKVSELQNVEYGIDSGGLEEGFESGWELEFVGLDWEIVPR